MEAEEDFNGGGIWHFAQDGLRVLIRHDWRSPADKPLPQILSFAFKPVGGANHRWAMAQREESLRLELARRRVRSGFGLQRLCHCSVSKFYGEVKAMIVRPVEKADWQEWLRMRRLLWPSASLAEHEDQMSSYFMCGEGFLSWVAEKSGKHLIGFLEASIRDVAENCDTRNVGYIEGWYVEPEFRRTGVGRLLVSHAMQWARARGCKEMGSDCELDNEISLKAHLSLGFEETSRLIHFKKRL